MTDEATDDDGRRRVVRRPGRLYELPPDGAPWPEWRRMLLPLSATVRNEREMPSNSYANPTTHNKSLSKKGRQMLAEHQTRRRA
jgi:hypothetical protein